MKNQENLLIGTNYHPHDWEESRWEKDLDLMKAASFNIVRLGHLCWDSFEPADGEFEFTWMDHVMDLCTERGIRVFLDIPTRPAPVWLHKKHPGIDIVDRNGNRQNAHTRYMEDVGDPDFQRHAYRLVRAIARRYRKHPALYAFGLCNELGAGFRSYSETARVRFTQWLETKYITVEALNRAWAGKRWSRKCSGFEQIDLPIGSEAVGAPERYLDMLRFYSDELIAYMIGFRDILRQEAPQIPVSGNHWAENPQIGFDYQKSYRKITDYPGQGFYPGTNPESLDGIIGACFCLDHRMAELDTSNWSLEFQTGGFGSYSCPKGSMRMYAYLTYALCGQMICAWTWRSMLGGEEQYLFGLLDHDGTASPKYKEFAQIAQEADTLAPLGLLPRKKQAEYAIAYSYESKAISDYSADYYTTPYTDQMVAAYTAFFEANRDVNIIDLRGVKKMYKAVVIPGHCMMEELMAENIKAMLQQGCHVVMTAFSAKVNTYNQVFDTPLPGNLSEVFGIHVAGFGRARTHVSRVNAGGLAKPELDVERSRVELVLGGEALDTPVNYHEYLQLTTADALAQYRNAEYGEYAAISVNKYGKGKAVYIGVPAEEKLLARVLQAITGECLTSPLPHGVVARELDSAHYLYINTTGQAVSFSRSGHGLLSGKDYMDAIRLPAYEVEILRNK